MLATITNSFSTPYLADIFGISIDRGTKDLLEILFILFILSMLITIILALNKKAKKNINKRFESSTQSNTGRENNVNQKFTQNNTVFVSSSLEAVSSDVNAFNTLFLVGKAVSAVGWSLLIISFLLFLYDRVESSSNLTNIINQEFIILLLLSKFSILGIISGLTLVVYGQIITCFVSIERNSKVTNKLLQRLLDRIDEESKR